MEAVGPLGSWKRPVLLGVAAVVALALSLALAAPAQAEFKFLGQWGAPTGGELIFPFDVDRDNAGNTYAVDVFTPAVHKYDAANNHVLSWGSFGSGSGAVRQSVCDRRQRGHRETSTSPISASRAPIPNDPNPALRLQRELPRRMGQHRHRRGSVRRRPQHRGQLGHGRRLHRRAAPRPALRLHRPVRADVGQGRRSRRRHRPRDLRRRVQGGRGRHRGG